MNNMRELFNELTPAVNRGQNRGGKDAISISVMCYDNKKIYRITLSNMLYEKLGKPEKLKFGFIKSRGQVFIAKELPNCVDTFNVKGRDRKYAQPMISSSSLIEDFISNFGLDFSQKHNQRFDKIEMEAHNGIPLAIVTVKG